MQHATAICKECGIEFEYNLYKKARIYCSYKCSNKYKRCGWPAEYVSQRKTSTCKTCGSEFLQHRPSTNSKFCSVECKRNYHIDVHYFDEIGPIQSYWIGFICGSADIKNINGLMFIFSRERETLERFNTDFNSEYSIRNSNVVETKDKRFRLEVWTHNATKKLTSLGVRVNDKSSLELPPNDIVSQKDFIKGYIDSDSSFVYKDKTIVIHASSINLLRDISKILGGKIFQYRGDWSLVIKKGINNYLKKFPDDVPNKITKVLQKVSSES